MCACNHKEINFEMERLRNCITELKVDVAHLTLQCCGQQQTIAEYRNGLEIWNKMLRNPNYDLGELCQEYTDIVNSILSTD